MRILLKGLIRMEQSPFGIDQKRATAALLSWIGPTICRIGSYSTYSFPEKPQYDSEMQSNRHQCSDQTDLSAKPD